jgi:uncharacterized protein DUF3592
MTAAPVLKAVSVPVPTELLGSVPRAVRLTGYGTTAALFAGLAAMAALIAAIVMSAINARADAQRRLRDRDSVSDTATVIQVNLRRGEHPRRVVTYRYDLNGQTYTGRATLGENDRRDVARGRPIPIEYLPSEPETSWLAGERPSGFRLWMIPLTALSLLGMAAAIARSVRQQWILLSEGRVALARVTGFKKAHSDTHRAYKVSYEFQTISGARQTARSEVGKAPPPIGAIIPIVYHRDQPSWSAVYPLTLVRPDRGRS